MEALELPWRKIDLHMGRMLSEVIKDFFTWRPQNVMNLIYLVELIISREQRAKREYLVHDTSYTPNVHLVTVVPVG